MNLSRLALPGLLCAVLSAPLFAAENLDPADFVDEASAGGVAEIETGKLALEKGTSPEVKTFAQQMIDDHGAANRQLAVLAHEKKLEVATEAELLNKAKALILQMREGENFDEAYANNQVMAHEKTVELFKQAAASDDKDIAAFAEKTLPKLEHHLQMARELASKHQQP